MSSSCSVTLTAGTGVRQVELVQGGPPAVLGRSERADVQIQSPRLSRQHAALSLGERGVTLMDLGSSNGTFVNGQLIAEALLRPGDIIQVGGVAIRVDFATSVLGDVDLCCERCERPVSMARCEDGHVFETQGRFLCSECAAYLRVQSMSHAEQRLVEVLEGQGFEILGKTGLSSPLIPVFRARRVDLDRMVSLKVLPTVDGVSEKRIQRFQVEARAAARIKHPNAVAIFDIRRCEGGLFIVMEHIEGEVLLDHLERKGPLSPLEGLRVGLLACRALAAAHGQEIVHRDLKPGGIVLGRDGAPKIADFGLAKDMFAITGRITGSQETLGTVRYMPPELVRNARDADPRSDLYSLGATLYHTLTGKPPYSDVPELALMSQVVEGVLPAFEPVDEALPTQARRVIAQAMAPEPVDRFPSAQAMEAAIGEAIKSLLGMDDFPGDADQLLSAPPSRPVDKTWRGRAVKPGSMAGSFAGDELVELVQMLAQSQRTGTLTVRCPGGDGHLAFKQGRLAAAVGLSRGRGRPAALEVLSEPEGEFEFVPSLPVTFQAEFEQELNPLLMEVARLRDERARG